MFIVTKLNGIYCTVYVSIYLQQSQISQLRHFMMPLALRQIFICSVIGYKSSKGKFRIIVLVINLPGQWKYSSLIGKWKYISITYLLNVRVVKAFLYDSIVHELSQLAFFPLKHLQQPVNSVKCSQTSASWTVSNLYQMALNPSLELQSESIPFHLASWSSSKTTCVWFQWKLLRQYVHCHCSIPSFIKK